jgi:hypothetical protein
MTQDEIVRKVMLPYVRDFCEKIKLYDDLGGSLLPSRMYAQGSACSPGDTFDLGATAMATRNRELAPGLLNQLKDVRLNYPEIAEEYAQYLAKAEKAWGNCIAS